MTYKMPVIVETPTFVEAADRLWSEDERLALFDWLAANPDAGAVIRGSGGCRKVRWSRSGMGKRGGVRVIYFRDVAADEIWMLLAYAKSTRDDIPAHLLEALRREIESD